jgi:hypothetical protein
MMPDNQHDDAKPGNSRKKWTKLPARIDQQDMVESLPQDPAPSTPPPAGNPDTAWMLRYS